MHFTNPRAGTYTDDPRLIDIGPPQSDKLRLTQSIYNTRLDFTQIVSTVSRSGVRDSPTFPASTSGGSFPVHNAVRKNQAKLRVPVQRPACEGRGVVCSRATCWKVLVATAEWALTIKLEECMVVVQYRDTTIDDFVVRRRDPATP
jgi:hypothetical protein